MKIKIISTEVVNKGKWNQVEVTYKNLSTDKIELKTLYLSLIKMCIIH